MSAGQFTAAYARSLMPQKDAQTHVDAILRAVEAAAQNGIDTIKSYACEFGSGNLYSGKPTAVQQAVIDRLTELGFKAHARYEEGQFVDIYLEVSWKE